MVIFEVGNEPWLLLFPVCLKCLQVFLEHSGVPLSHKHPNILIDLCFVTIIMD